MLNPEQMEEFVDDMAHDIVMPMVDALDTQINGLSKNGYVPLFLPVMLHCMGYLLTNGFNKEDIHEMVEEFEVKTARVQ